VELTPYEIVGAPEGFSQTVLAPGAILLLLLEAKTKTGVFLAGIRIDVRFGAHKTITCTPPIDPNLDLSASMSVFPPRS
jgi:hypothetical protein